MAETPETSPATGSEDHAQLVAEVAARLGEHEPQPLGEIRRAVRALGPERVRAVLDQALEVERQGGLMTGDGSRRRTPGGTFFYLLRRGVRPKERGFIFGWTSTKTPRPDSRASAPGATKEKEKVAKTAEKPASAVEVVPWRWDEFEALAAEVMAAAGEATVKITLVGRPGKVQERGEFVLFGMVSEKVPALPNGVPAPEGPTRYAVLLATKQWRKVAPALEADPQDKLVVEGYPTISERFSKGILVHATTATTVQLQASKRATPQAGAVAPVGS